MTSGSLRQVQDLVHLDQMQGNAGDAPRSFSFE